MGRKYSLILVHGKLNSMVIYFENLFRLVYSSATT